MAAAITMGSIAILLSLIIIGAIFFQYASAFVNIVSPERGEAVPAGSSLTVSGTSDDNPKFNCKIQIIVNDTGLIRTQFPSPLETIQNGLSL